MKPNPDLINRALNKLQATPKPDFFAGDKIPNKYKGYISSFGGSIVQLGIMPACMVFIANPDKIKLVTMLFSIYKEKFTIIGNPDLKDYLNSNWQGWQPSERKQFRNRMAAIAVSFKLALRTFEIDDTDNA